MSRKRITIDTLASLAMSEFNTLEIKRRQAFDIRDKYSVLIPSVLWKNKTGPGLFTIEGNPDLGENLVPSEPASVEPVVAGTQVQTAVASDDTTFNGVRVFRTPMEQSLVPEKDPDFVAWGHFNVIKKMLSDPRFMSIYLVGETGNGKTFNFEQAAAQLKKEVIIVPFTEETEEDDLICT
jgi:hypothetical protein